MKDHSYMSQLLTKLQATAHLHQHQRQEAKPPLRKLCCTIATQCFLCNILDTSHSNEITCQWSDALVGTQKRIQSNKHMTYCHIQVPEAQPSLGVSPMQERNHKDGWWMQPCHVSFTICQLLLLYNLAADWAYSSFARNSTRIYHTLTGLLGVCCSKSSCVARKSFCVSVLCIRQSICWLCQTKVYQESTFFITF